MRGLATRSGRVAAVAVVAGLALAVAVSVAAEPMVASFATPQGALIAPGPAPDVTLLYTGDVIGYVDPCG